MTSVLPYRLANPLWITWEGAMTDDSRDRSEIWPPAMPTTDPHAAVGTPVDPYAAVRTPVDPYAIANAPTSGGWYQHYGRGTYPILRERARSLAGLGIAVLVLITVHLLLSVGTLFAAVHERDLVHRIVADPLSYNPAQAQHADDVMSSLVSAGALLYIAAGIVFIVWLWRARSNLEAWDTGADAPGQAWAITAWLPVVNFVAPAVMVAGIIRGTTGRVGLAYRPLLIFWQLAYDTALVVFALRATATEHLDTVGLVEHAADVNVVYPVALAVAAVPALAVVLVVTRLQNRRIAARS